VRFSFGVEEDERSGKVKKKQMKTFLIASSSTNPSPLCFHSFASLATQRESMFPMLKSDNQAKRKARRRSVNRER